MDDENKKKKIIISIILFLIVFTAFLFLNSFYISKGGLLLNSNQGNFTVSMNNTNFNCQTSSCEVFSRSIKTEVTLSKQGYFDLSLGAIELPKFKKTIPYTIIFQKIPTLEPISNLPNSSEKKYELILDTKTGFQKLIDINYPEETIVFFQNPIIDPSIFSNDKTVIVIDNATPDSVYKINTLKKSREKISDINLQNVNKLKFSKDASNIAFTFADLDPIWVFSSDKNTKQLEENSKSTKFIWGNAVLYLLSQNNGILLKSYDPQSSETKELIHFDYPKDPIKNIFIPTSNTDIYFETENEKFRIDLGLIN